MNVIARILHRGVRAQPGPLEKFKVRRAARAVLWDSQGRIALINVREGRQHKIPGGGVDEGEKLHDALRREVREEVGADIDILGELGMVIQYDEEGAPFHVSYGYSCRVRGKLREPQLTSKERKQRFVVTWVKPEEAIRILRKERHWKNPQATSIRDRELSFILEAETAQRLSRLIPVKR